MRKTIVTIVVVALTLGMNAQEVATDSVHASNVDVFMPSANKQPKKQVTRVIDTERKVVVLVPNKTAKEIYTMVEVAIAKHWKNPEEVIVGSSEGRYIKISGGATNVNRNVIGTIFTYPTTVNYTIQFKDGKFMYTMSSTYRIPPSQYSLGGDVPTHFKTHRKSGKPIKLAVNDLNAFNEIHNLFINEILQSDPEQGLDSEW